MDVCGVVFFRQFLAISVSVVPGISVNDNLRFLSTDETLQPGRSGFGHNNSDRDPYLTSGVSHSIARVARGRGYETARARFPTILARKADAPRLE